MTEREMYLGAIKVLQERGWCKAVSVDTKGRHCMVGALYAAAPPSSWPGVATLLDVVGAGNESRSIAVADFNDYHCATANDAIAALQIAADLAA